MGGPRLRRRAGRHPAALEQADLLGGFTSAPPGGRVAVDVLPHNVFDRLLLSGFRAEVWMEPGVTEAATARTPGWACGAPDETAGVAVVMGAGNISSIAPLDVLYQLFAYNRVVMLKLNPVTDALLPVFDRGVRAVHRARATCASSPATREVGDHLVTHRASTPCTSPAARPPTTRSCGAPARRARRRRPPARRGWTSRSPANSAGCRPTIVVPGRWSKADLRFQAEHIATQRLHNSGFNCVAAQIVIVSSRLAAEAGVPRRAARRVRDRARPPGLVSRLRRRGWPARGGRIRASRPSAAPPNAPCCGASTWATAPSRRSRTEYFGPVLGVAELPGTGAEFLDAAVDAANERLHGTLGANLVIDPRTRRQLGAGLRDTIARLRYGTIGVNAWTGVGYLTARATWGAFPGHPLDDIASGRGVVHNALLLHRPERTVVYGPFRPLPRSVDDRRVQPHPEAAVVRDNRPPRRPAAG